MNMRREELVKVVYEMEQQIARAEQADSLEFMLSEFRRKLYELQRRIKEHKHSTFVLNHATGEQGYCIPCQVIDTLLDL